MHQRPGMDVPNAKAVDSLLSNISIAAVSSWLKQKGVPSSAATRDALTARVLRLFEKKLLTWPEIQLAALEMEESSSKRVILFDISDQIVKGDDIDKRAAHVNAKVSTVPCLAPSQPTEPTLVYVSHAGGEVRAKYAETQYSIRVDLKRQKVTRVPVTKVVVAIARPKKGILQI